MFAEGAVMSFPLSAFWNARQYTRTTEDLTAIGQSMWERCRLRLAAEPHHRSSVSS